ncbi:MAG: cellulose synthase family protein [Planctomycetota bacterium]|jgi:cellulose synthase/poly-beta-1,6-N-acetylglucosamine synthase-like glycosyltransferase
MDALAYPLLAYYALVMVVLCTYGLHRYWMVWLYLRHRRDPHPEPRRRFERLPAVTVQLPMFNESRVAARVIDAVAGLDYPRDRLQVQVLDDSNDDTTDLVRRRCATLASEGLDIEHRHRDERRGYKAGALEDGLAGATGELVAVFDADFVPPPDFLRRTVDHFTDPEVGMVQARWSHLNRDESLLTRIQAMSLDAHFIVEQTARARTGRWFNFNGTAGVWRRRCIEDAGGWQHDTLTEDTDLSYRAQLRGWRFVYLPQVCCAAEIPPTISAFRCRQHRWNKGLTQTAIKLLPTILRSAAPLRTKIEAWFHLTSPLPYLFILLLVLLVVPSLAMVLPLDGPRPALALGLGVACLGFGTMAAAVFYLVSQCVQRMSLVHTVLRLLALMAIGIGISVLNTRALLEAVFGGRSAFIRTPKFNGARSSDPDPLISRRRGLPAGLVELLLGSTMTVAMVFAATQPVTLVGIPFLVLFAAGFLAVGIREATEALGRSRPATAEPAGGL